MPSNKRSCPHCKATMACGIRLCIQCGKLLARKERHTKCLETFRKTSKLWAKKTIGAGNQSKVVDRSFVQMEKMKALGYVPLLLWGKVKRGGNVGAEMFFPHSHKLSKEGDVVLDKLLGLFERLLQACNFKEDRQMQEEVGDNDGGGREMGEDVAGDLVGDEDGEGMAGHEDGEEDKSVKEGKEMVMEETDKDQEEKVEAEEVKKKKKEATKRKALVTMEAKRSRTKKIKHEADDQSVESRLQVKMNSPDSTRDISIKQEEPEDHPHLNILHMIVCKEEDSPEQERSPSLLQEEPELPHIKEEQEELLQRPEEPDESMLTLLALKSEEGDDGEEDISSHCYEVEVKLESDTEVTEDSDDWEETSEDSDDEWCEKSFSESSPLKTHQCIDTRDTLFHCKQCKKSFTKSAFLKSLSTMGKNLSSVKNCDKCFSSSGNLNRHQRVHTGEKPFYCKHCDKRFSESSSLKTHQRVHTGEKPFHCKYCDKHFRTSSNLNEHQRVHTGEKPFHCKHCDKRFNQSANFKRHLIHHWKKLSTIN